MNEQHETSRTNVAFYCAYIVFLIPLAIYIATAAPTVYGLDSAELSTGAYVLGIVHSPGSPTYMLLGHLFSMIPVGDVGYRLNLLSALFGASAILMVYCIAIELRLSITSAMLASGLLAFSFYFWTWALVAELYAPHAFFASVVFYCILKWQQTKCSRFLLAGSLLFGLGCGNHTALVLLLPGYAWLILSTKPSLFRRPGLMSVALLCGILGLSVYAYFPLRQCVQAQANLVSTYFPEVDLRSASGLFWMIRGGMFKSLFFSQKFAILPSEGFHFLHILTSNFTPFGIVLAAIGCLSLCRINKPAGIALILLFGMHTLFFLTYGAVDRFWMFSISYVVAAIWAAAGIDDAESWLRRRSPRIPRHVVIGVATASVALLLIVNWPLVNLSNDNSARNFGILLGSNMERGAVFFGLWEQIPILEYLQVVEGWRKDIDLHNSVFLDQERVCKIVVKAESEGRAIYTSQPQLIPLADIKCIAILTNNLYRVISEKQKGSQQTWPSQDR